jgi:GT2 family glycosyltransferase
MTTIAIIFPIFNGISYTRKCLPALYRSFDELKNEPFQFRVIIVDDGSTDGSAEWIKKHYPEVELLNGNGNLWWSGGINKAVKAGLKNPETDYFIWWNNDVIHETDYFKSLITLLRNHSTNTIIGSKIYLDENYETIWSMGGLFNPVNGHKHMIGTTCRDAEKFQVPQDCDWLTGMGTITHRSVYERIGLLDEERFPQYHGDSDFTFRAKKAGFKIIAVPDLKIYNDTRNSGLRHDESFKLLVRSLSSIKSNFNVKKDFLFYRKHVTSPMAYLIPVTKYVKYIGGYFKWKMLGIFGIKRKS